MKVSPGCENCYAEAAAKRYGFDVCGPDKEYRTFGEKHWNEPRKWNKAAIAAGERRRVFCASMMDYLDLRGPAHERAKLWPLIDECTALDWLLLTKRIENAGALWPARWLGIGGMPRNVWLLTTVEDQRRANERIPELIRWRAHATVLGLSVEPQLEAIDLTPWIHDLDWVIVGGESGHKARSFSLWWARSIVEQCAAAGVACFVKQLGAKPTIDGHSRLKLASHKGGDLEEWPMDLRRREFPRSAA